MQLRGVNKMVRAVTGKKGLDVLVAGLGMMGHITSHILEQAGGRVIGILGLNEDEVNGFIANNRLPNLRFAGTFNDYSDVLRNRAVEAVAIAVPNYLHEEMGVEAANAGKHILIEKPLATSVQGAKRFYDAALKAGVAVEINSQYRHHEILGTLRQMIDEGDPVEVEMGYIQGWQANPTDAIGWRPEVAIAGRGKLVGDLGVHTLQTTLHLFGGEFTQFNGRTYNVHPKRFKPKGELVGSFGGATIPGPNEKPELWEEMDMLDGSKYSGDDRAEAHFELKTRTGKTVNGKYILSQVDTGDEIMGNENNFYIRVKMKDGTEIRWFQEDPNHLDVLREGKVYQRIERGSAPGMIGRPGGHPHGYGDAILIEADKWYDVAQSGSPSMIKTYTEENIGQAVEAVKKIDRWLATPLQPYNGELDAWLTDVRFLRVPAHRKN
jgi:predicted dehydrogenase